MLTDIYSLPQLITLFSKSEINDKEIEFQILEKIDHADHTILRRRARERSEVSVVFPYKGATIGFVVAILNCFGITQLKFCRSRDKVKVCKVKLNGVVMTEAELLSIVHKIELVFHMAQFADEYQGVKMPLEYRFQ